MFNLESKIIIITGGAGLLGSRFSEIILKHNGLPVILDNSPSNIATLKKEAPEDNIQLDIFFINSKNN